MAQLTTPEVARAAVEHETEAAGRTLGVRVTTTLVTNPAEVERAFVSIRDAHAGGIVVGLALRPHWSQILQLALRSKLPTVSGPREFVEAGGLMAYGPDYPDLYRRAATYVDKILKGAQARKPSHRAADEVPADHRSQDGKSARRHHPAVVARPRR